MRKEVVEYAKTVKSDTLLSDIQKHVENMDELRYVFRVAYASEKDKTNSIQKNVERDNKD